MTRYYKYLIIKLVITFLSYGCQTDEELIQPSDSFSRVYETQEFSDRFKPIAIQQTADSGYLTLSKTEQWRAHLFKSNDEGITEWSVVVEEPFVNPLPQLFAQDSGFLMFGMNEFSQSLEVYKIYSTRGSISHLHTINNIKYPLAVNRSEDNRWLFLGYNRVSQSSTLHSYSNVFTEQWSKEYAVQEDVEEYVIDHVYGVGSSLPFFVGFNGNYVYFNGFYNYSFSLVFAGSDSGDATGALHGYRNESMISALHPIAPERYAIAQTHFDQGAILSQASVSERSVSVGSDLPSVDFNEIDKHARVVIKAVKVAGKEIILYGTQTKQRQLIFYAYGKESGELISINTLGQTHPYFMGDFTVTADGGLVIVAETLLTGKFSRVQMFRLSPQEFKAWF